jgi:2-amino-4-hydroxy-6-hydroxymethyldihydropteridine diphosphokinase
VEDDDADGSHEPSLASGGRTLARTTRAYVGLGANLGDASGTIAAGVHALAALPGVRLQGVSRLYATAPVGVVDQPEFRNAAVALDVPTGPDPDTGALALLIALKGIERAFGRRERERWGPRELDLDLLVFGRHRIDVERPPEARSDDPDKPTDLVVPHRLAGERLFVLAPLADLAPGLVPPGWTETVARARARRVQVEGPGAVRPVAQWADGRWEPAWRRLSRPAAGAGAPSRRRPRSRP